MDTVSRFNDRSTDYVRYRPSYPAAAIDFILEGFAAGNRTVAADVGAGTGISARLLGGRGVRVIAVEPGEAMRRAAAPDPHVAWMAGTAEATGLRSHAVDLVLCAQAFHWFRVTEALTEFARILGPHGRLALMWNRRTGADPLTLGYGRTIAQAGGAPAPEATAFDPELVTRSGLFTSPDLRTFPNRQRLDLEGLIGRARSASYAPNSGAQGDTLIDLLRTLHGQHADADGFVTLVHETEVFRSQRL